MQSQTTPKTTAVDKPSISSKRIAMFIMSLQPGGAERAMVNLANYWAKKGHNVTLVTLASPLEKPFYSISKNVKLLQLSSIVQQPSLHKKGLQHWLIKQTWGRRLIKLQAILRLRHTIKQLKPDVVISFIDLMNIVILVATKGLKIPVIVSERIDPNHHHIFILLQKLRNFTYPWASKIIVQTKSARNYFSNTLDNKLKIIPNAVAVSTKTASNNKDIPKHIVTVGRLNPQKDQVTLIRAFAAVAEKHPDLKLTIYGEGRERPRLEQLIQTLGLEQKIKLPGVTPNIKTAILNADLFVFPSKYEGFPNALGEAMSVGLPVIATNCSGNSDLIRDGIDGKLFPVGDVQALTNLILELCEDPKQLRSLGQRAKEVTERFSEEKIYGMWDNLIYLR